MEEHTEEHKEVKEQEEEKPREIKWERKKKLFLKLLKIFKNLKINY